MIRISVQKETFETIGYGNTRNPQVHAIVWLHAPEGDMKLWEESSAAGFASYSANQVLPAAQRYARKLAKLLNISPPTTWKKK